MFQFRKAHCRLLAGAVVTALAFASSAVQAGQVKYYTEGSFGVNAPAATASTTVGGSTLKFTANGTALSPVIGTEIISTVPFSVASIGGFGSFQLTSTSTLSNPDIFNTTFTLKIYQLAPGTNNGTLLGTVSGTVANSTQTFDKVNITANTLTLPGPGGLFLYSPDSSTQVDANVGSVLLTGNIQLPAGTPLLPLPPALLGGVGLLGTMAVRKRLIGTTAST
jgi:hypothetical protein